MSRGTAICRFVVEEQVGNLYQNRSSFWQYSQFEYLSFIKEIFIKYSQLQTS